MPIYEYQCTNCGHTFEKLQPVKERAALCPQCGRLGEKIMSASVGYMIKEASYAGGRAGAPGGNACCGQSSPCENPKRCCGK